jgi:FKBP-type peptidyl-prolyl cis-trans isomerase FkpA
MNQIVKGKLIIVSLLSLLTLSGCMKSEDIPSAEEVLNDNLSRVDQAQLQADLAIIDDSLANWSITPLIEPNGVRYKILNEGTGPKATLDNFITINYRGKLLKNHSVFDQGTAKTFQLRGLILGWQTALPLINEGSTVVLYIPSGLAYGTQVFYDNDQNVLIPANSNLIFEIELLDIN